MTTYSASINPAWYADFKRQKNLFVAELKREDISWLLNWKDVRLDNPSNLFIMFAPGNWGHLKRGWSGVHYIFAWHRFVDSGKLILRLSLGVEKPLLKEYRAEFKREVVEEARARKIWVEQCDLWPNAGLRKGTKLLETRVPFGDAGWKVLAERYRQLAGFNELVGGVMRRRREWLDGGVEFPGLP